MSNICPRFPKRPAGVIYLWPLPRHALGACSDQEPQDGGCRLLVSERLAQGLSDQDVKNPDRQRQGVHCQVICRP